MQGKRQDDVARLAKISASHLSLILAGKRTPSLPVAERLAAVLRIDLSAFL